VLTYNIHHGEGVDGKVDLPRIADVIKGATPDVVAVQEVDQGTQRTAHVDQPAELARLTGLKCIFARNIDWEGGGYGTAVLTRLPVKGVEQHRLPSHYKGEQRGVQVVELGAGDDTFVFFATHLNYRPEEDERLDSVKKIRSLLPAYGDAPMVLAGDLNAEPGSETMKQFGVDWQRANAEPVKTYPAEAPAKQIDYVLVRPAERWTIVEVRVLDEAVASDHRPVLAVFERVPK
jgi:endonuclease/exonuclease/phosphatase family metal-dependent hydrolase